MQRAGGGERAVLISVAVRREGVARHLEKASTADILSRRFCPKVSRHYPPVRANHIAGYRALTTGESGDDPEDREQVGILTDNVARCLRTQRAKRHVMSIAGPGSALLWEKVR